MRINDKIKTICLLWMVYSFIAPFPWLHAAQDYRLGPDDTIKITVYREEELNRVVRISPSGSISFPLLGKVQAEGLTVTEFEEKLTQALSEYIKKPQVTVYIEEYSTVSITGQVKKPGSYPLKGRLTVIEAIGIAGGFTKFASRNDVRVMRVENGKEKTIKVEVSNISKNGDLAKDVQLKRGDVIYVPESLF